MSVVKHGYKPAGWFRKQFSLSASSLRLWESNGKITAIKCPGGKRIYNTESVERLVGIGTSELSKDKEKKGYIYARVSSAKQKEDLERQIETLKKAYPSHSVIKDVGSGVNFKRQGLRSLLDRVYEGMVQEIVVLHKDRLSRFAAGLLEYIFEKSGVRLVVHSPNQDLSGFSDLADDLLAITTFFVASHNGKRSAEHRRMRRGEEIGRNGGAGGDDRERKRRKFVVRGSEKGGEDQTTNESEKDSNTPQ